MTKMKFCNTVMTLFVVFYQLPFNHIIVFLSVKGICLLQTFTAVMKVFTFLWENASTF